MINDIFENGRIDIHGGGQDLKFPHHENEIAQSRALNGHPIADTWMHNQMININNEKMSKSLGNVVWAKDLIVELGCNVYKWFMLSSHYRNPLNMTNEIIEGVKKEVAKVENVLKQTSLYVQVNHLDGDGFNKDTVYNVVIEADFDKKVCNATISDGSKTAKITDLPFENATDFNAMEVLAVRVEKNFTWATDIDNMKVGIKAN